jgi:hypothetical protein
MRLLRKFLPLVLPVAALAVVIGQRIAPRSSPTATAPTLQRPDSMGLRSSEYVLVFIGSSRCSVSQSAQLRGIVKRTRAALGAQAARLGTELVTVGVSVDSDPSIGLDFLRQFGAWSEMSVGRGWLNETVIRYVWRDLPGEAAVPQLLLFRRDVHRLSGQLRVTDDAYVVRKVGIEEMQSWVNRGIELAHESQ